MAEQREATKDAAKSRFRVGDLVKFRGIAETGKVTAIGQFGEVYATFYAQRDPNDVSLVAGKRP